MEMITRTRPFEKGQKRSLAQIVSGHSSPSMAASAIAKADIWAVSRDNIPFIIALLLVLILCTYVPWISLELVHVFYGR